MARKRNPYGKRTAKRAPRLRGRRIYRKARKPTMYRMVRKALSVETKEIRYNGSFAISAYNTSSWAAGALQLLMPVAGSTATLAQGTGQANRIGNKVATKSLIFSGILTPKGYDATLNPYPQPRDVMMVIFSSKSAPTDLLVSLPNFLQSGNSAVAPTGTQFDTIVPINTDKYTVFYKRIFKIGTAEFAGTGINAINQRYANNDYKYNQRFRINCTRYINKVLRFDDTNNIPNNRFLWVAFLVMNSDGIGMLASETQPIQASWNWNYRFTDV